MSEAYAQALHGSGELSVPSVFSVVKEFILVKQTLKRIGYPGLEP